MKIEITMGTMAIAAALATTTARADDDEASRRALARIEHAEPSVEEAVAAALRYAGLSARPEVSMRRRARLAAALPALSFKASRATDWTETEDARAVDGAIDQGVVLEVRATWRLDRLVFDGAELRVAALGQQRARARAALAAQATALYYKRREAQLDAVWHPADTVEDEMRRELALAELTAQLDALTGGWWGDAEH
jgi:hypothetical protein